MDESKLEEIIEKAKGDRRKLDKGSVLGDKDKEEISKKLLAYAARGLRQQAGYVPKTIQEFDKLDDKDMANVIFLVANRGLPLNLVQISLEQAGFSPGFEEEMAARGRTKFDLTGFARALSFSPRFQGDGEIKLVGENIEFVAGDEETLSIFHKKNLTNSVLTNCRFPEGMDFREGNFNRVNFEGTNLTRVDGRKANFNRANLANANLSAARLQLASLESANLRWANLKNCNLEAARLFGASLIEANLENTNFDEAWMPNWTKYSPEKTDLTVFTEPGRRWQLKQY